MFNTKSSLFKILASAIVVIGLALGILLIPNMGIFDEEPLPEITELLRKPINPNVEGNAAYHLYGFAAASDKDTYTVGKAVVNMLQSKHPKGEFAHLTEDESKAAYGGNQKLDEEWSEFYPAANCKPREKENCFELLLAEVKEKPLTNSRLLTQLERYHNIVQLPHLIEETRLMDYTSPLPNFYLMMQTGKLSQADAYLNKGLDGLISNSQADMGFWRMALTDSQTLIGRMVTFASLRRNLSALSYAISKEPASSPTQIQALQALLQPLTTNEINMEKVLIAELRFGAENWKTAPNELPEGTTTTIKYLGYLHQPTATSNWFYRQTLKPVFAFNKMPPTDFFERAQTPTKPLEFSRFNPYNLGGKIIQSQNWQYAPYIGRAHDLAGMFLLVALQLELKANPPQDLTAAIKASAYKNPYTEKPFDYDAATKALSFQCFDAKDVCKITL